MFSKIAVKLYYLIKNSEISTNLRFWRYFFDKQKIEDLQIDTTECERYLNENNISLICVFDNGFIDFPKNIKNSEKPILFAYRGDINLIKKISQNVAVIGVLEPTDDIKMREEKLVNILSNRKLNIVSGLAKGCDTIAHKICLNTGAKTIAILPTTLENIYPKENKKLADEIVKSGGLLLTEYVTEPQNRFERVKRFIDRDRLQAMLSKAVILVASFRYGEGDSGARHAMQKAKEYSKQRFIMFNEKTDSDKSIFGLNQDLIKDRVEIIIQNSIKNL